MLGVAAVRADVHGHVLDQPEHGDVELLEHLQRLARIQGGDVLRRGHDHRAGHRDLLRHGQLDVAGARRQVDHQVVEVAPAGVVEQLGQRRGRHRPAPDHRRVLVDQQADRHRLDAVRAHRLDGLAVGTVGPARQAQHRRHAGAVDVGIQHAHRQPFRGQRQRQVHRGGGLAHPALAGADGDDVADFGEGLEFALDGVGGETGHGIRCCCGLASLALPLQTARLARRRAMPIRSGIGR